MEILIPEGNRIIIGQEMAVWAQKGGTEAAAATRMLTTGQAAKLCNVKPDTILKWVKSGKLEAVRTQGGHFRIDPRTISLLNGSRTVVAEPICTQMARPLHCWEYLGHGGVASEACSQCIVYQCHSAWCFRLKSTRGEPGHAMLFCTPSCDECAYYRRVTGLLTHVLLVTRDQELTRSLVAPEDSGIALHLARHSYEASAGISSYHPSFALVDQDSLRADVDVLVECLTRDPRVPGLKVVLCTRRSGRLVSAVLANVVRVIHKPFGIRDILAVIESFPVEKIPVG